jgi:hypothetical protein
VVGAYGEASNATGVGGDQTNNSASNSGAAYVFTRNGGVWNSKPISSLEYGGERFVWIRPGGERQYGGGWGHFEASSATGVNGDQTNNGASGSGAVYVFQ